MALDPGSGRRSVSPESSGRESPAPRQWRNQLGTSELLFALAALYKLLTSFLIEEPPHKDKHYRKYASGVDRTLALFDTTLQEWADYISFLNRLLKVSVRVRHCMVAGSLSNKKNGRRCKLARPMPRPSPRRLWLQNACHNA
jgi:hypothetical protein